MPFKDLAGHSRVTTLLARAIAGSSLPPSLLFSGLDGVGKRTTAVAVAEALNCITPIRRGPHEVDGCGECTACRRIARNTHPDILIVSPGDGSSIKVEPVREAIERTDYRPFEGRKRVIIIDDADTLEHHAQSALLKRLEEPPSGSVFILVTARPDVLLPTVRSRCAQLRFARLAVPEIEHVLTARCRLKAADARQAASLGEGSVARALEVHREGRANSRAAAHEILQASARARDERQRLALAKDLLPKESGQSPAEARDQLAGCLRMVATLLRDVAVLNSRADRRMLANADLESELGALTRAFDRARAVRAFTAVDRALGALDRHASPKLVADWLVLQI